VSGSGAGRARGRRGAGEPVEILVGTSAAPCRVWVGSSLLERAAELIPVPERAEVIALVADEAVAGLHGRRLRAGLAPAGRRLEELAFPPGEASKTLAEAERLLRALAVRGLHRGDLVVSLGGGVASDLAGFVAATFHRGVACAHCPTTLLAQVDAAIGGKTGVNLPEGKNLVGVFHQPVAVLADVSALRTLPEPELRSGLAEVAKHGFIADPGLLEELLAAREALLARDEGALARIVARAAVVKARIVERDETEAGERRHLNYGHTLGHALEALGGWTRWRHGEAVSLGMTFAAALAARLGLGDRVAAHRRVLEALGLPTRGAGDLPLRAVVEVMRGDKKYEGGIRFVVLEDLGRPRIVEGVGLEDIAAAFEAVS
jgi:3-dehydroquinate synthase